jgi:hypothetical protein
MTQITSYGRSAPTFDHGTGDRIRPRSFAGAAFGPTRARETLPVERISAPPYGDSLIMLTGVEQEAGGVGRRVDHGRAALSPLL